MKSVSVRHARANLRALLDRVTAGDEIVIVRRGRPVARLVAPKRTRRRLPDLAAFRASLPVKGKPLSETVIAGRREARF